jgi:hypothetical protein
VVALQLKYNHIISPDWELAMPRKQEAFEWAKTTDAYQRIIHLSDLEDRWDGYDAPRFSREQIDRALTLYSKIRDYSISRGLSFSRVEPFIAPGSDGTILLEWAGKRFPRRQLEVYVPREAADKFEYLKTGGDTEEESQFNLDGLSTILDWLFKFEGEQIQRSLLNPLSHVGASYELPL